MNLWIVAGSYDIWKMVGPAVMDTRKETAILKTHIITNNIGRAIELWEAHLPEGAKNAHILSMNKLHEGEVVIVDHSVLDLEGVNDGTGT